MKWKPILIKNYHQLIFVFIAFLLMIVVSIISMSAITRQKLISASDEAMHTVEANIKVNLQEPEATLVGATFTVQNMVVNQKASQNEILQYLSGLTDWLLEHEERVSGFNGIYGVIRGDYLDGMGWTPPEGYIPQERPWYSAAEEKDGQIAMTAPYIDAQTQVVVISIAQEVCSPEGEAIGVISLDVMLTRLTEYVSSLQHSYGGYGIMLDSDFVVIAHPDKKYAGTPLEYLSEDYAEVVAQLEAGRDIAGKTISDTDGERMILFFRKLYNGWYVGMLTPADSYYSDMHRMEAILIVMGCTLMLALSLVLMRLAAAKMRSDEENQSKSSFLARMSHEIRTPMNAILGMAELALREDVSIVAYDHIHSIKQAGANLLSIINDILDFSKIEAGNMEIVLKNYSFSCLIDDVVSIIRMRVMNTNIRFVVSIDSNIPNNLIGDEIRIRQILLNLLSNAVKYTEEGFVSFTVTGEMTSEDSETLTIEVSDSGRGIKKEDIGRLFGEFVQVDLEKNNGIEGTGLGLAITRSLIKAMGGDISLSSEYGKGSTFTVTLPQRFRTYEKLASVEDPEQKSVLVYERREIYAGSIACALDNLGVDCTLVSSEQEFYEKMESRKYSFVLLSSFLLQNAKRAIARLGANAKVVLLTEFGEEVVEQNLRILSMPVYTISIANVLNDIDDSCAHIKSKAADARFAAPTARILIVDDISTNLKVAEGLLSPYKTCIELCNSGADAIEKVKATSYDIVFMDHMMPEMDGIEAVKRIRALDGTHSQKLPIVALTANAVSGMQEMFLENGFDDYLAKPIEMPKLNEIMHKWIPVEKRVSADAFEEDTPEYSPDILNIDGLDMDRGLMMTGGSMEHYREVLELFCHDAVERMSILKEAPDESVLKLFITQVHALKSASASIGATVLSVQAAFLESAGQRGKMDVIRKNLDAFREKLEALVQSIEAALEGEPE